MSRGKRKTTTIPETTLPINPESVSIIKTANCPSSSGRSELTYQLGQYNDQQLCIRIHGNSNNGYFNDEWVSVERILAKLSEQKSSFSSFPLKSLFEGKSINTPHFLIAILLAEGLLVRDEQNSRYFLLGDVDGFMTRSKALMANGELVPEAMTIKPDRPVKPISRSKPKAMAIELTDSDESLLETLLQAH